MVVSNADIKCSNMASRLLASRASSAGGAAASTTNQTLTSRTITGRTTSIPTRTSNNTAPPSVVGTTVTTNDTVSDIGSGASAVFMNQQRSNDFILTNDQLLGITVTVTGFINSLLI